MTFWTSQVYHVQMMGMPHSHRKLFYFFHNRCLSMCFHAVCQVYCSDRNVQKISRLHICFTIWTLHSGSTRARALTAVFQVNLGWNSRLTCLIFCLRLLLYAISSRDKPKLSTLIFPQSHHVFFRRPVRLDPPASNVIQWLTRSSSILRSTYPNVYDRIRLIRLIKLYDVLRIALSAAGVFLPSSSSSG